MTATNQANKSALEWAADACSSLMHKYAPAELPPANRWHYHQGVFLFGMLRLWEQTQADVYFDYIRGYVDSLVDEHGNFSFNREELDSIQAGVLLFTLHRVTGDARYKIAADKLKALFATLNKTSEGGYFHKDNYPYQMWLDGLYMGGSFAMLYAKNYGEPELFDMVVEQERLMRKNTRDERTGLYFHAWDESRKTPWSNPNTGRSPEFWGRAMGWYAFALNDFLDDLPSDHPGRQGFADALDDMLKSLVKVQDQETGLWYQVLDKGDDPANWLETSCSALFIYAMAKGLRKGYVTDPVLKEAALRGWDGLKKQMKYDERGRFVMPEICIGTGVGNYEHYLNRPRSENDLHGVGAFVLACVEVELLLNGQ